jgi:hypothetical protein
MIEQKNALDIAMQPHPVADAELEMLQHKSFSYFLHETNPDNGLVIDKTAADWPASIAATGLALAAYPVAAERGFMSRAAAAERTLTTLRFFWSSPQGPEPDATGYQGFYYHFLDMRTGRRAWQCELSTVDTAFLLAGALTVGVYFDADTADEYDLLDHETQDVRAAEAVALFCYHIKKWIGAFAAALSGLDALVFAGGIGEKAPVVRTRICDGLGFPGVELDEKGI